MKTDHHTDMHAFLVKLLIPIYVVVSLSLVISHAKAIEHPRRNLRLRETRRGRPLINVSVRPKEIELYPGDVIRISCKAKGGPKYEDAPYLSFYREVPEMGHIPLSSGDPGILIEPATSSDNKHSYNFKKILKLGKFAWYTLEWGENLFYCQASDLEGHSNNAYFVVVKKWHDSNSYTYDARKRRNLRRRLRHSRVRDEREKEAESEAP